MNKIHSTIHHAMYVCDHKMDCVDYNGSKCYIITLSLSNHSNTLLLYTANELIIW